MNLKEIKKDDTLIIEIDGRLDTNNYQRLESRLSELIENGAKKIILNCEKLIYLSSSGLRVLLVTFKKMKAVGGSFVLCSLTENISEVLEISGFNSIFTIFPHCEETTGG
jgi:anti-anti-sigma factor